MGEEVTIIEEIHEPDPFTKMVQDLTNRVIPIVQQEMDKLDVPAPRRDVCSVCKAEIDGKGFGELYVYNGVSYDKYVLCKDCVKRALKPQ